jgi:hypothetical protein
LASP